MSQAGVSRIKAIHALRKNSNDIVNAIMVRLSKINLFYHHQNYGQTFEHKFMDKIEF